MLSKMSRSGNIRRECPSTVSERIDKAKLARLYVVQELGPLKFIVQEDRAAKFKVSLGHSQSCTCKVSILEKELCIHLLWVLLRVFRVEPENELIWQTSLVEREIGGIVRKRATLATTTTISASPKVSKNAIDQRPINDGDCCPICMEGLDEKEERLSYCKTSCGNSIHTRCMRILLNHQEKALGLDHVKCPLCRNSMGTVAELKAECAEQRKMRVELPMLHFGYSCKTCLKSPISGSCHRCTVCKEYHVCNDCFDNGAHSQHTFENRAVSKGPWGSSTRIVERQLPDAMVNLLQNRELTADDYEMLLTLDQAKVSQGSTLLHIVNSFPLTKLGAQSHECKVCAVKFKYGDVGRTIPCGHIFHRECIDRWLLHQRSTCPLCGLAAFTSFGGLSEESPELEWSSYSAAAFKTQEKIPKSKTKRQGLSKKLEARESVFDSLSVDLMIVSGGGGSPRAEVSKSLPKSKTLSANFQPRILKAAPRQETSMLLDCGFVLDFCSPAADHAPPLQKEADCVTDLQKKVAAKKAKNKTRGISSELESPETLKPGIRSLKLLLPKPKTTVVASIDSSK